MLFILNKKENVVGVLDNSAPFACPYFDDRHVENIETGVHYYEFSVPASHETAGKIEEEGYVILRDLDNRLQMFKIKNIEEVATAEGYLKRINAEHIAIPELLSDVVRPVFLASTTLENALEYVLQGTLYELGEVDYLGSKDISLDEYGTVLQAIHIIAEAFGAEIQFEVVFEHGEVKKRLIHVTKQRGTVTKKLFTYGKDLVEVKRTVNTEDLVTALVGIGKGDVNGKPLTLAGYTSSLPDGYSKPIDVDYIANDIALQLYGKKGKHIFGIYLDDTATNKEMLFDRTLRELQTRSKPKVTYECKVTTLERITGYEAEKVRVGDTVIVQDLTFEPELVLEARIIELTRSYTNPENDEVVLGDYRPIKINTSFTIQKLKNIIAQNEEKWNARVTEEDVNLIVNEKVIPVQQLAKEANVKADTANTKADTAKTTADSAQKLAQQADSKAEQAQADATNALQEVQLREIAIPRQPTEPTNPQVNGLWIDTSKTPNILKRFDGTQWKPVAPTKPDEIGAVSKTVYDSQINQLVSDITNKADLSYVDGQLVLKANSKDVYTRNEVDTKLGTKADKATTYTKTEVDNALKSKVSVTQYTSDINGIVTKLNNHETRITQTENEIATKVSATTYQQDKTTLKNDISSLETRMKNAETSITQLNNQISLKANASDVYTKKQVDASLAGKSDVSTVSTIEQRVTKAEAKLDIQAGQIASKVSQSEFNDYKSTNDANVANLQTRMTNAESSITQQANQIALKVDKSELISHKNAVIKVRYIRDWLNGSSANTSNHWVEIKAMSGTTNRAKGKTITSNYSLSNGSRITDDDTSPNKFAWGNVSNVKQYVQIDLGAVYEDIDYIQVWHYYADGRTYNDTKLEVSEDGKNWVVLFDSAVTGKYKETADGLIVQVNNKALNTVNNRLSSAESRLTVAESRLTVAENSISTKVSQATYDADINNETNGLKARMISAESAITQHANEISLKVSKDGVISAINQTAEQIKISASKIALDGYVEAKHIKSLNGLNINNQFVVDENGNVTIANDKVKINSNGVTVKNANFYIEDELTLTKYIIDVKTNLIYDHSFELIPAGSVSTTYRDLYNVNLSTVDGFNNWARTGSPLLRTIYQTDLDSDHIMFGYQQMVVNASNHVWQEVDVEANQTYTISFHVMYPMSTGMIGGVPKVVVEFYGDDMLISSESKNFTVPKQDWNTKERHAFTFTAPNILSDYLNQSMRIKLMSTDENWVEVDGVQLVKGEEAVAYNAEDSLWRTLLGQEKARDLQTSTLTADKWMSAKEVYLQTLKGTYKSNTIINDHLNGNISVSASGGDLYIGYYNTNYIRSQKEHWMMAGGRVKAGSWIVENGDIDATNGIVLGGAFKFTSISKSPTSSDGVFWYGNGFSGKGLYIHKGTGWVFVK